MNAINISMITLCCHTLLSAYLDKQTGIVVLHPRTHICCGPLKEYYKSPEKKQL